MFTYEAQHKLPGALHVTSSKILIILGDTD